MAVSIQELQDSEISKYPEYSRHYKVIRFEDSRSGLLGFIAIHRNRGPLATGGTRYATYTTEPEALRDALRLSVAMTAKCIVSGLPYGGAKGVIMAKSPGKKSTELLSAYAQVVESLSGAFRTGEDVGMTEEDVQVLLTHSQYFNGKRGIAGDPSPFAAQSVALVMDRMVRAHLGAEPKNLNYAIKGVGKVGGALAHILINIGAEVIVSDTSEEALNNIRSSHHRILTLPSSEIAFTDSDVYSPCALGNEVTADTISKFRTRMICGGANNQLASSKFANILESKHILYVPDYLANAGGLINVSDELESDGYNKDRVEKRISLLGDIAEDLYLKSRSNNRTLLEEVEEYVQNLE